MSICAATGVQIPLEALRYWSVDLQEAYANPNAATRGCRNGGWCPGEQAPVRRRAFLGGALALVQRRFSPRSRVSPSPGRWTRAVWHRAARRPCSLVALDGRPLKVLADGRFTFGFAFDQTGASLVTVRYPDGGGDSRSFTPAVRQYETQAVNGLPQATVTPPPEVQARIARETEAIYLARLTESDGGDFLAGFDWPAPGILSGVFGSRRIDNGVPMAPHFGVDMAAPTGTPIRAPADGKVSMSADHFVNGGFTLIDHGQGVSTSYLHQSARHVAAGDMVRRGQVIGSIGQTGRATGPHLHWAMNWFQMRLDPSRSTRKPAPRSALSSSGKHSPPLSARARKRRRGLIFNIPAAVNPQPLRRVIADDVFQARGDGAGQGGDIARLVACGG